MSNKNQFVLLAWAGALIIGLSTVIGATETNLQQSIKGVDVCFLDIPNSMNAWINYWSSSTSMAYCKSIISLDAILLAFVLMTAFIRYTLITSKASTPTPFSCFIIMMVSVVAALGSLVTAVLFIAGWFNSCSSVAKIRNVSASQCSLILLTIPGVQFSVNTIYAAIGFSIINFILIAYLCFIDYLQWQQSRGKKSISAPRFNSASSINGSGRTHNQL